MSPTHTLIVTHLLDAESVRDSRAIHGPYPPQAVFGPPFTACPYPQVITVAGAEQGRMTGLHARFPPKAGIRPGVYGLSLPTSHHGCWRRAGKDDGRSRPFPAEGGYSARRLRRVGRPIPRPGPPPAAAGGKRAGSKGRTGRPVLKHGPNTADAETGRERPCHGHIARTADCG